MTIAAARSAPARRATIPIAALLESHLQRAEAEHQSPHHPQALERELEADREQQEGDAELGERVGERQFLDQTEGMGSDQNTGDQITEDRAAAKPSKQRHDDHRSQQEHQQVGKGRQVAHRVRFVAWQTIARAE